MVGAYCGVVESMGTGPQSRLVGSVLILKTKAYKSVCYKKITQSDTEHLNSTKLHSPG